MSHWQLPPKMLSFAPCPLEKWCMLFVQRFFSPALHQHVQRELHRCPQLLCTHDLVDIAVIQSAAGLAASVLWCCML